MRSVIVIIHILVCISMVLVVLLQSGKGANMGAAFGGSSQTIFGSSGPGTFLGKATTVVAIIFMLTSLWLAYFSIQRSESVVRGMNPIPAAERTIDERPAPAPIPGSPDQTAPSPGSASGN